MTHTLADRTLVILLGGAVASSLLGASAQDTETGRHVNMREHVHRLGDNTGSLIGDKKALRKSPFPYSSASFSNQAYKDAVSAKLKDLHGQLPESEIATNTAAAVAVPPTKVNTDSPAVADPFTPPPRPPPSVVHMVSPSGLDSEVIDKLKAAQRQVVASAPYRSSAKPNEKEISEFQDTLSQASFLLFSSEQRPNGMRLQIYRYGINILTRPETLAKLDPPNLTPEAASILVQDYSRMLALRVLLNNPATREDDRAAGQLEYNELLSKHFVLQTKRAKG